MLYYCLALYGSSLWRLDCPELHSINVSFNDVIRQIWNLPRNCHTGVVHSAVLISSISSIIVFSRFCRLRSSALSHPSLLVRPIFATSSQMCNSKFLTVYLVVLILLLGRYCPGTINQRDSLHSLSDWWF